MSVRTILTWPDPRLRTVCAPVGAVNGSAAALAYDLLDTMYDATGSGLAAPQIGVLARVCVIDAGWRSGKAAPRVLIDPVIESASDERVTRPEPCLSLPGIEPEIDRPAEVTLRWTGPEGATRRETLGGIEASCAQHEIDNLDGLVTLDRVAEAERARLEAEYAAALA